MLLQVEVKGLQELHHDHARHSYPSGLIPRLDVSPSSCSQTQDNMSIILKLQLASPNRHFDLCPTCLACQTRDVQSVQQHVPELSGGRFPAVSICMVHWPLVSIPLSSVVPPEGLFACRHLNVTL